MRSPRHSTTIWAGKSTGTSRLCRKTPSSAREETIFRLAKLVPSDAEGTEAGDIGFIVDAAPDVHRDRQGKNEPLEARSSFPAQPGVRPTAAIAPAEPCGLGCYDSLRAVSLATRKAVRPTLSPSVSVNGATYRSAANITESAMEKSISLLRVPTYAVRESRYSPAIA